MPPRYAYWTILIDNKPTAFRARDKEELLPTLRQLQRKSPDAVMRWFARGRLWDTPEQAQWAAKNVEGRREKRGRDWRPGGEHTDPRARFQKRKTDRRPGRPPAAAAPSADRPSAQKPGGRPTGLPRQGQRPWTGNPQRVGRPPWRDRPPRGSQAARPGSDKPRGDNKAAGGAPVAARKPGDRSWRAKPGDRKPWSDRDAHVGHRPEKPFKSDQTSEGRRPPGPPKPHEDRQPPNKRGPESPETPPTPEQIVVKPEPPERG